MKKSVRITLDGRPSGCEPDREIRAEQLSTIEAPRPLFGLRSARRGKASIKHVLYIQWRLGAFVSAALPAEVCTSTARTASSARPLMQLLRQDSGAGALSIKRDFQLRGFWRGTGQPPLPFLPSIEPCVLPLANSTPLAPHRLGAGNVGALAAWLGCLSACAFLADRSIPSLTLVLWCRFRIDQRRRIITWHF